jgi:hypothetical protein
MTTWQRLKRYYSESFDMSRIGVGIMVSLFWLAGCWLGSCTTHNAIRDMAARCYVETSYRTPDPTWIKMCEEQEFRLNVRK